MSLASEIMARHRANEMAINEQFGDDLDAICKHYEAKEAHLRGRLNALDDEIKMMKLGKNKTETQKRWNDVHEDYTYARIE